MALRLLQSGDQPLGQFDGYDNITSTMKGGEVGTIIGVAVTNPDKAAWDANGADGYVGNPAQRPYVTTLLASGTRPLFLLDEGITGYGTLFGSVVGGTTGMQSVNGAVLGPHSALASGKITCWDKPGTYAVTLDAVDTTPSNGLVPTNTTLSIGDRLYATAAGVLTPAVGKAFENVVLGRFIEFTTDRSLVTTPNYLVAALNSPGGNVTSLQKVAMTQAIIYFAPPIN